MTSVSQVSRCILAKNAATETQWDNILMLMQPFLRVSKPLQRLPSEQNTHR